MLEVSFSNDSIVFTNPKNSKSDRIALLEGMGTNEAIKAISSEQRAAVSASRAAVSLLSAIMDNPRLDGYRGTAPIGENIPKELKEAVRDLETEFLKPAFITLHTEKGAKPATAEAQWQTFATNLRKGGSYAVSKGKVIAYFAYCGMLPKLDNGKYLSVSAIEKLLANEREKVGKSEDVGIAGKLVSLSLEIEKRTESTKLGEPATAIAALKTMLATYEGLLREQAEAAKRTHELKKVGDVTPPAPHAEPSVKATADKAVGKARRAKRDAMQEPALV